MRFIRTFAALAAFGLLATPALAKTKDGVTMPDSVTVAGKTLKLNGLGTREATIFAVDVYVAGLYVEEPSSDANQLINADAPKKLVLEFVRDVDKDDITDAFTESFEKNKFTGSDAAQLKKLNGWMGDIKEGQTMAFTYVPGQGLEVEFTGKVKGTIPGKTFQAKFLSIWLGQYPPNSGLKKGLLGK